MKIKKTHKFVTFSNCSTNDVILRHDVDSSVKLALEIAKIDNSLNVQSTFFIYFNSEFYNPFSLESTKLIKEILRLNHKLGLHYNETFILQNSLDPSLIIKDEIESLELHFKTKIEAISVHEAAKRKNIPIKLPDGVVNVYSDEFFIKRKYLSDSAQHWREGCFCKNYLKYDKLQILTHPLWWSKDNKNRSEIMKSFIGGEYDDYTPAVKAAIKLHEDHIQNLLNK